MTDQLDTAEIRKQMAALNGFVQGPWKVSPTDDTTVITHDRNMVAEIDGDYNEPDLWPIMEANARLIAAAPDMHATILTLCDENDKLRAALQPFAEADEYYDSSFDDDYAPRWAEFFTIGDFRRARAALTQKEGE